MKRCGKQAAPAMTGELHLSEQPRLVHLTKGTGTDHRTRSILLVVGSQWDGVAVEIEVADPAALAADLVAGQAWVDGTEGSA